MLHMALVKDFLKNFLETTNVKFRSIPVSYVLLFQKCN